MIDPTRLSRPGRLRPGDRIAVVSLSWGGPGTFPHRFRAGTRQLREALDVDVVAMPHALREADWIARNPRARADDLHAALMDPEIAGIISSIGGDDSIRVLRYLELDTIASHPKVFMGYSDTTTTQMAFLRAGVVSFYGPAVMAGFGESAGPFPYMLEGVRSALFEPRDDAEWPENPDGWTAEHLDWGNPANQDRRRTLRPSTGWRWLGGRSASGPVVPGCLEVLDWLRGTAWWPDLDGAVLALETSEEEPPSETVVRFLRSLAASGELARLRGLMFGRPGGAELAVEGHGAYDEAILQVVVNEEGLDDLPVVTGLDFGHTDPIWTIPVGMPVEIDVERHGIRFVRSGVM